MTSCPRFHFNGFWLIDPRSYKLPRLPLSFMPGCLERPPLTILTGTCGLTLNPVIQHPHGEGQPDVIALDALRHQLRAELQQLDQIVEAGIREARVQSAGDAGALKTALEHGLQELRGLEKKSA